MYNGDNALSMIRDHVGHTNLNMVARGEYVGHIERSIRLMKERARCSWQGIQFIRYTVLMVE